PDKLLRRVQLAAERGYAIVKNETVPGDISVAAPVMDLRGNTVCAINIAAPTTRWTLERAEAELAQHVQIAATSISKSRFNR
ncbi:MAG TPA: IclR family transcriptional regulator C-terminal domain-containing protein, partial [Pusillimonas sp.]